MNYIKAQIKRTSRNRMIIFGCLATYFGVPAIALLFDPGAFSEVLLYVIMMLIFAAPAALFTFFFICALASYMSYTKSKQYKRLQKQSQSSVEELNMLVSRELNNNLVYSHKGLKLTKNWVCLQLTFGIHIRPVETMIWIYKHITKTNYFVTYYAIHISFTDQKQFHIRLKNEAQCDALIELIARVFPHVLLGYTKYLYSAYKNNFNEFMSMARDSAVRQ